MITVVSGRLGSGKSYDTTRLAINHLSTGGAVRTNMTFKLDSLQRACNRKLYSYQFGQVTAETDPATIPTGDRRGSGKRRTLVILDECLNWFDSESSKSSPLKQPWSQWLRQSDKLGQDVYFIAQNFDRAAKWIRELAQLNREMVPIKSIHVFGIIPIGLLIPFGSRMYFVRVWDVRTGTSHALELHKYSSYVWNCYDTAETYGFVGAKSAYDILVFPRFRLPKIYFYSLLATAVSLVICVAYFIFF